LKLKVQLLTLHFEEVPPCRIVPDKSRSLRPWDAAA
jgi:hypothetical protein